MLPPRGSRIQLASRQSVPRRERLRWRSGCTPVTGFAFKTQPVCVKRPGHAALSNSESGVRTSSISISGMLGPQRADPSRQKELRTEVEVNCLLTHLQQGSISGGGECDMSLHAEEECPVSPSLLGRLYHSSPEGLAVLVETVPSQVLATLAFYCYRRVHLEGIGLAIASTCTEAELVHELGRVGRDLFAQAQSATNKLVAPQSMPPKSRRGVTLATGPLWKPPSLS